METDREREAALIFFAVLTADVYIHIGMERVMFGKKREKTINFPKGKGATATKIVLVLAVLAVLAGNSYY